MPTPTWENQEKLATQTSQTYNQAGLTYGDVSTQYNGKQRTGWTNQTEN